MPLIKQRKGKKIPDSTGDHLFHARMYEMPVRLFVSGFLCCFQIFLHSCIVISFSVEFLCTHTGSLFSTLLFSSIIDRACCTAMLFTYKDVPDWNCGL